eukprot:529909-Rhodomonas_salina.3
MKRATECEQRQGMAGGVFGEAEPCVNVVMTLGTAEVEPDCGVEIREFQGAYGDSHREIATLSYLGLANLKAALRLWSLSSF